MARRFLAHCFALAALGVFVPALSAQDHLLDDLYGRGVHAYFSRNYSDAHKLLSEAIASGSKDARVYYFRALADKHLNRPDDAAADLKAGAELEFSGDEPVKVGRALERIQGAERLMIEDQRSKARLTIRNAAEQRAKVRYEERVKAEEKVLRNPPAATAPSTPAAEPPEALPAAPPGAKPAAPAKPAADDPFSDTPAKPAAPPAEGKPASEAPAKPAVPPKPAADDPFGDTPPAKPAAPAAEGSAKPAAESPAKPAVPAKPAAEDPFGDTPAKPAAPPAEAKPGDVKPAAAIGEDPPAKPGSGTTLGSFLRAITKSVPGQATGGAAKPAVEEAPIPKGDPNAPDPFGDAPAKPAAPAAKKPAAADPFKDDVPAKPAAKGAAADDPFK